MTQHSYSLQRYAGKRSRHTCPSCGGRYCFTRYVDENGEYNFPYHYLRRLRYRCLAKKTIQTKKRFSFCCTLLTNELLQKADFQLLDPTKNWYDVTISHWSLALGFRNLLMLANPVLHFPHASRPWKRLKYTNPLLYYWRKITQKKDRI